VRKWRTLVDGGGFFEAPRWHNGRWWVADFYHHQVLAVTEEGATETVLEVPTQPSGLGWMPDDSLLVVSMRDHRVLRLSPEGTVTVHAELGGLCGGHLNDMVVDTAGHAFVGDFGFDLMGAGDPKTTNLVRIDPEGTVTVVAEEMHFPNGMVITPDGSTLVVGETMACRYTAFDLAPNGQLANRRVWVQLAPAPVLSDYASTLGQLGVAPDGCTMDAEQALWVADALGGRLLHVARDGEILEELHAPEGLGFFACMLGGPDGRHLLACAAPDFFEANRSTRDEALLLVTEVEVPHGGLP